MHGPSSRVENASRKTSPVAARCTTTSAGTSEGVTAYVSPPKVERLERERDGLPVLLPGAETKASDGIAGHTARVALASPWNGRRCGDAPTVFVSER